MLCSEGRQLRHLELYIFGSVIKLYNYCMTEYIPHKNSGFRIRIKLDYLPGRVRVYIENVWNNIDVICEKYCFIVRRRYTEFHRPAAAEGS